MKYNLEKEDKYTLFRLEEDRLDSSIAPKLKSEFITLFQAGTKNFILDLNDVKYADSSGLSAILVANRMAGSAGGSFVLTRVADHVMKLITISRLDSVLNILPSVEEARDNVFMAELEREIKDGAEGEEG